MTYAIEAELLFDKNHQLFLNFDKHTDQTKNSILYLNEKINELAGNLALTSAFKYLDVGCGFGNKTLTIIQTIKKYHPVAAVALDPSATLLSIFKKQTTDQAVNLICSTWESYRPETQFNFISSIHTFYYIDNWNPAITKMIGNLAKSGMICIAIRSNDDACKFKNHFFKKLHPDKKERTCDELCELLTQLGISYKKDIITSKLDINDCLLQNIKGEQLIEFLLRQPYAKLNRIKDEIISYLENTHKNGCLIQQDGYIWISGQQ